MGGGLVTAGSESWSPIPMEPLRLSQSCHPSLRHNLVTTWEGRFVSWIRSELADEPSTPQFVKIGHGALFFRGVLVPVAFDEPGGKVCVVRQGAIPRIGLSELVRESPEPSDISSEQRPETQAKPSPAEGSPPPSALIAGLRAAFGEDRVLEHLNANDRRFPPEVLRDGDRRVGSC